jgi:hypothetical protein
MARPYYKPGRYWGKVTHQRVGKTSKGNPQLVISFLILGVVNPADPDGDLLPCGEHYERSVFRVITENTIEYVQADVKKLGWSGEQWHQFDEEAADCVSIVRNELAFSCTHEPHYETGEPVEKWSIGQNSMGPNVEALSDSEYRKLDAMFGRALKTNGKRTATPTAKKEAPQPAAPSGEEFERDVSSNIPF